MSGSFTEAKLDHRISRVSLLFSRLLLILQVDYILLRLWGIAVLSNLDRSSRFELVV